MLRRLAIAALSPKSTYPVRESSVSISRSPTESSARSNTEHLQFTSEPEIPVANAEEQNTNTATLLQKAMLKVEEANRELSVSWKEAENKSDGEKIVVILGGRLEGGTAFAVRRDQDFGWLKQVYSEIHGVMPESLIFKHQTLWDNQKIDCIILRKNEPCSKITNGVKIVLVNSYKFTDEKKDIQKLIDATTNFNAAMKNDREAQSLNHKLSGS